MHLAGIEVEIDVVVGEDSRKPLGDASKLEDGSPLLGHAEAILGGGNGPPPRNRLCVDQLAGGLILPLMMSFLIALALRVYWVRFAFDSLRLSLPKPTPLFRTV